MLIILLLLSPLLSILLSFLTRRSRKMLEAITVISATVNFVVGVLIVSEVIRNGTYTFQPFFSLASFEALILGTTILTGSLVSLHLVGYLRGEQAKKMIGFSRVRECYVLMHLFLASMFVAITTTNPIIMWIAIESTTLSTVFLVSLFNRTADIEAAWKYLIINSIGLLFGLLGTVIFISQTAQLNNFISWNDLNQASQLINPEIAKIAFIFILVGFGTKMGLFPLHTWKPDAYNKAPLPVVALLSGSLLNIAFFGLLRYKLIIDGTAIGETFTQSLFILLGTITILFAAVVIFTQTNYKRLFAYSSIEHAGIMMIGFGFGGIGVYGAILHMIYHAIAKSFMFLVASNIALKYSSSKISDVTGMLKTLPINSILFIIGTLAILGLPPFGIFYSEFYILSAGFNFSIPITVGIIVCLSLVMAGVLKAVLPMVFGEVKSELKPGSVNNWVVFPAVFLAVIFITLSIYIPEPILNLIESSSQLFIGDK